MVIHYFQKGISLIELMITITILAILVIMGTSLTTQWAKQAELDKAIWSLQSAIDQARTEALRNKFAIDQWNGTVSSQLCLDTTTQNITVHSATSISAASCSTPVIISYPLASSISIKKSNNNTFVCLAFNNRAQLATTTDCSNDLSLQISNGGLNETTTFN